MPCVNGQPHDFDSPDNLDGGWCKVCHRRRDDDDTEDALPYCDFCHTVGHAVADCEDIDPEQLAEELARRERE